MSEHALPAAAAPRLRRSSRARSALADSATMAGRCLRMARRHVDVALTSLLLPVLLMLLFVYLFGGAIQTGTRYVTYVVPGVLLLCAGFGASMTAVSVTTDMTGGIVDRFAVQRATLDDVFLTLTGHPAGRPDHENEKEPAGV